MKDVTPAAPEEVKMSDALLSVERKLAFGRQYQEANILSAASAYIEKLEAEVIRLKADAGPNEAKVEEGGPERSEDHA